MDGGELSDYKVYRERNWSRECCEGVLGQGSWRGALSSALRACLGLIERCGCSWNFRRGHCHRCMQGGTCSGPRNASATCVRQSARLQEACRQKRQHMQPVRRRRAATPSRSQTRRDPARLSPASHPFSLLPARIADGSIHQG